MSQGQILCSGGFHSDSREQGMSTHRSPSRVMEVGEDPGQPLTKKEMEAGGVTIQGVTGCRASDTQQSGAQAADPAWKQVLECRLRWHLRAARSLRLHLCQGGATPGCNRPGRPTCLCSWTPPLHVPPGLPMRQSFSRPASRNSGIMSCSPFSLIFLNTLISLHIPLIH